jgi:hypothetical protein
MTDDAKRARKHRVPPWDEGGILSFHLRDDLYTVGLMKRLPYIQFYDVRSEDGKWSSVDLDSALRLICVGVVQLALRELEVTQVDSKCFVNDERPFPSTWLRSCTWIGEGYPFRGADLINLDPSVGSLRSEVLKYDIDVAKNMDLVRNAELTNLYNTWMLRDRLLGFFNEGIDRQPLKALILRLEESVLERTRTDIQHQQ